MLKELGLKVTKKGVLLPESRKTVLRRRRETRQALEGEQEALQPVLKKRKTGGPEPMRLPALLSTQSLGELMNMVIIKARGW